MNWKKIAGILVGLAVIAVVIIKLKSNKEIAEGRVYHYDKEQPIPVTADTIKLEKVHADIRFTGTFQPYKQSTISAEQNGKINRVLVDEGSFVHKGQSLVELDHSLLDLQLQSVEVEIKGLEQDVERYTVLAQADAIQRVKLEKAELGLQKVRLQKATLAEQISKTTISAPFEGVVTAKLSEEGAFAAPGVPLLQITDIAQLKFTIQVPENDLQRFDITGSYSVSVDVLPQSEFSGRLVMIGSQANRGNRFPIQFLVSNTPDLDIKSGMFGKVQLQHPDRAKGITVPSAAVSGSADQPQVYVVKSGKAVLQNITITERMGNQTIVESGLNAGDVLITSGFVNLFEGAPVDIQQSRKR